MKKRIIALLLACVMVLGTVAAAAGMEKTISVTPMALTINGQNVTPTKSDGNPAQVFAYEGATYVPLRYLAELLGIQVEWDKNDPATAKLVNVPGFAAGGYVPGTYEASAQGFGGPVTVTLTVDANGITDVKVAGPNETPAIGGAALEGLAAQIKAKGAAIDGVSGATLTSNAAKEAAAKAIAQASGEKATAASLTSGTYTATRESFQKEHVTVSVTVAEGRIADVKITEITDHPTTITDAPCKQIPAAIVANQTYNVDGVTGATFTSTAIKNAVKDCLDQAGGSDAFSAPVKKAAPTQGADVHTDILVVGGGAAGMTAAVEAYSGTEMGQTSGLKVMLIEKAGFLGGNTSVSGGGFIYYTDETGAYGENWRQQVVKMEEEIMGGDTQENYNRSLLYGETGVMKKTLQLLDYANVTYAGASGYHGQMFFTPAKGEDDKKWAGSYITKQMNKFLPTTDIDVRLETAATGLLTDKSGAVIGVTVKDKAGTYNIYAGKVILSCGGFAANKELIAQYAPDWNDALTFCAGTNTGDGFVMAKALGAGTVGNTMFSVLGVDNLIGIRPEYCFTFIFSPGKYMGVNLGGERFMNETMTAYNRASAVTRQKGTTGWGIVDSDNECVSALNGDNAAGYLNTVTDMDAGYVFVADTLEELAGKIGVPADKLAETVKAYNATIDSKGKDAFGVAVDQMDRLDTAPYYAWLMRPCTISSLVALTVDGSTRVLTEDGKVIPNLFATGDMVLGNLLKTYSGGHGVGTAIYTGDLAAQTAKAELAGK